VETRTHKAKLPTTITMIIGFILILKLVYNAFRRNKEILQLAKLTYKATNGDFMIRPIPTLK